MSPSRTVLRHRQLSLRNAMDQTERARANQLIWVGLSNHLEKVCRPAPSQAVVACYWPIQGEPDLRPLFPRWGQVALPVVAHRGEPLRFARWRDGGAMRLGPHNIPIPEPCEWVEPDIVLLPCLGFFVAPDGRRYRLGYGGGYYDRTLAQRRLPTAGIAFAQARLDVFPLERHDIALDAIITPERTF